MGAVSMAMPSCPVECRYVPTGAVGDARMCAALTAARRCGRAGRGEIRAGKGKRGALKTTFFVLFFGFTRVTTYQ